MSAPNRAGGDPLTATQYNENLDYFDDNKVEKIDGKSLSTNDFTTALKDKMESVEDNANNYSHPEKHAISDVEGLSDKFNTKQDTINSDNKLSQDLIVGGNLLISLNGNGDLPFLSGKNLTDVAKPKKEILISEDTTLNNTHMNNIIVVKDTGTLTTLKLPKSDTVVGKEVLIINETDNHTKVIAIDCKINTFNYYALMELGANIRLTATSTRWIASIVGNIYNDVYLSV